MNLHKNPLKTFKKRPLSIPFAYGGISASIYENVHAKNIVSNNTFEKSGKALRRPISGIFWERLLICSVAAFSANATLSQRFRTIFSVRDRFFD